MELIIAKFGGTSIGNGKKIRKAAQSVVNEYMKGNKVVVVVSAINKTTDNLIKIVEDSVDSNVTDKQMAEILSMGEMTSVRVMSSVIESLGVKSEYIDPYSDEWPLLTDNKVIEARIDFKASELMSKELNRILDQGIIPVVCGFLGKGPDGEITTLGRGGSDITAFLLGHSLNADEVIIVTDVDGVMSTDPNKIQKAKKLDKISVEEMRDLATHGAQVLHPHALRYKDPLINAKIISHEYGDLSNTGTTIVGPYEGEMMKTTMLYPEPISVVAIVGDGMLKKPGLLSKITTILAKNDINIFGISAGQNSVTIFINKKNSDEAYHLLHDMVIDSEELSSLSLGKEIAMLTLVSPDFIETPGIISDITVPLRENNINIVEISSSQTAVVIFVEWADGEKAFELVKDVLE
ncbi:aspartate kinase [Methanobrevibacter arboriphilus]|uniref:Aspartate kinase n=1 Tax=Methanobrevibacter arboriphilus TaxID=39441 RepID=A0ACA8R779_METAZ|nr:aspartate kinase [Methanobrevibacter arboriphilus]MCC7562736.1 aspartate kinase [Methanobrevibacter arboriphilus]BBL62925.1 aspartate kinase [Methanobrevibacter arboriphilus]GLI12188.1 aspartate kinase [Methanobrevibacter arboriphilus]